MACSGDGLPQGGGGGAVVVVVDVVVVGPVVGGVAVVGVVVLEVVKAAREASDGLLATGPDGVIATVTVGRSPGASPAVPVKGGTFVAGYEPDPGFEMFTLGAV